MQHQPAPKASVARPRELRQVRRCAAALLLGSILGLGTVELAVRALAPLPLLSPLERFHREITVPDRERLYRLRPGARSDWSRYSPRDDRRVPFTIDAEGRRAREFDSGGSGPELRVACLGDSTTMGFGVGDEEHFAYLFGSLLARRHPERRVRVFNFGTHGYTSAQGRAQFEREVLPLAPALVCVAFGFNDANLSGLDERSAREAAPPRAWATAHELLDRSSATYHLLWKHMHPLRAHPTLRTRVLRTEFEAHLRAIATRTSSFGGRVVLIDSCIPHSHLRHVTAEIAREFGAPHLCLRELFELAARSRGSDVLSERAAGVAEGSFLRVRWRGSRPAALVLLDRTDPLRLPQLLPLRDDGRDGDEVAGDGIQTLRRPVSHARCELEWTIAEIAAVEAHPEILGSRFYRLLELEPGQGFDAPILDERSWLHGIGDYLRIYVEDCGHPNALGHAEIARALDALVAG
jgi:lysophospholipase L1-like esterase